MDAYALELNDAQIIALNASGELLRDTAYAYLGESAWVFGAAAAGFARLHPQRMVTRHFAQLDAVNLGAGSSSAADVAYRQALNWTPLLGGAPGIWLTGATATPAQLGLLLGVAQAAQLNIQALADRAVASVCALPFEGRAFYFDVELERGTLCEVQLHAARAIRQRVVDMPALGQRSVFDNLSKAFAARMVHATRFDPLHLASSEQQLFDALPGWLAQGLRGQDVERAVIHAGDQEYSIPYPAAHAAADLAEALNILATTLHSLRHAQEPGAIVLSATAVQLPGLLQALDDFQDCDIFLAGSGQGARAALSALDVSALPLAEMSLRLSLPHIPQAAWLPVRAAQRRVDPALIATHVVHAGTAIALSAQPLLIGSEPAGPRTLPLPATAGVSRQHCSLSLDAGQIFVVDHSRHGTFINDEPVVGRALIRAGDRLRLGNPGVNLSFVRLHG